MAQVAKLVAEYTPLGVLNAKEYVWARYREEKTGQLVKEQLEWKVPDIRKGVRAEQGYKILAADYSQIEVKLMAYLSGDPTLIAAINSGKDIHCFTATEVFGKRLNFMYDDIKAAVKEEKHPRHHELKKLRANIKVVTFGIPYGAGAQRVSLMTGMTVDEAQQFIDDFFARFPKLKMWLAHLGSDAIADGFTTSPRGRKRFYELPLASDPDADQILAQIRRWAGNHPIQAGNVDMLKPALRKIYLAIRGGIITGPRLFDARLLLAVHDEIVVECLEKDVPAVKAIMEAAMQESYDQVILPAMQALYVTNKIDVVVDDTWEKA
jgi:DNA polymerase I